MIGILIAWAAGRREGRHKAREEARLEAQAERQRLRAPEPDEEPAQELLDRAWERPKQPTMASLGADFWIVTVILIVLGIYVNPWILWIGICVFGLYKAFTTPVG